MPSHTDSEGARELARERDRKRERDSNLHMLTCFIKQDQFFQQAPVPIYTSAFSPFGDGASGYDHL